MNFNSIHILFLIIFLYNASITCATIQTLLPEIVKKILMFNNFDLDDYHSNISIANSLNKNSFFQDSPCQIVAYLFQKPKPNLMLTCKQFDNYIKRNIKNEIPLQHQLYINFLIENQSLFNFKKKIVLENLALLFFNVHNKKIDQSYNNDLKFYEPLAFALTFKKYNRNHLVENRYNIQQYQEFFNNVLWFNQNLTIYYFSEPEKLVLINYFSNHLNIQFFDNHKPIFEKLLKTEEQQKRFLKIIKECTDKKYDNQLIKILFYSKDKPIKANKNTIKIIEFFISNNINLGYKHKEYINSETNEYKNTLKTIELSSCYKSNCNDCLKNKKSLIAFFLKKNFYNKTSFLGRIIKFLIKQENNCNHTTFENQNIKNWIQKKFPTADYEKFINIVSLLKNTSFIDLLSKWDYTSLLDKNSTVFKNMVKLRNFCQKCNNYALKAAAHLKQNREIWCNNYYLTYGFQDNVLFQVKCYCYNCNKNRLYTTLYYILLFTASSILIFCIFSSCV